LREGLVQGRHRGLSHGKEVSDRADLLARVFRAELLPEIGPFVLGSARRRRARENGADRAHVGARLGRETGEESGLVVVAAPEVAPGGADERLAFELGAHGRDALVGRDGACPLLARAVALGHADRGRAALGIELQGFAIGGHRFGDPRGLEAAIGPAEGDECACGLASAS
jgi:hypothetical protein